MEVLEEEEELEVEVVVDVEVLLRELLKVEFEVEAELELRVVVEDGRIEEDESEVEEIEGSSEVESEPAGRGGSAGQQAAFCWDQSEPKAFSWV